MLILQTKDRKKLLKLYQELPFLIKVLKYKGVIKPARVGAKRAEYNCEQI